MIALRDYQQRVLFDVDAEIAAGRRRVLIVAPTGAGKTVIRGRGDQALRAQRQARPVHRPSPRAHLAGITETAFRWR